ncbi:MAG: crosslink repair DNA glycosylase YcaQ family protein [Chloroflexota bacterium]
MTLRTLSPLLARRLAITRQHLAGQYAPATPDDILNVVRDLGCLQLDPISVVARSHQLVLFSRLGAYDRAHLDALLWRERRLFEYWAHCASIVLTEDYPIHRAFMRNYAADDSAWSRRVRKWLKENAALRRAILTRLRREGPLPARVFEGEEARVWVSTGWTSGRNVSRMFDFLWLSGAVMVAGRDGLQKVWDLSKRCLPEWTPREKLSEREIVRRAAQRSLRALGVATPRQIQQHFIRGRYPNLTHVLAELEKEKRIERAQIVADGNAWKGDWYIHTDDIPLLEKLSAGDWEPRATPLSPFDNLICDRARTKLLFDFDYAMEIYTPKAKRKYGYYVLPILHGDQFVGRMDMAMDRARGALVINAVYAERDAPKSRAAVRAVADAVERLAEFLRAQKIELPRRVPRGWESLRR